MQAQSLRNAVDELRIRHAQRDDIRQVDLDEVDPVQSRVDGCIAHFHEYQEDDGDEEEEGAEEGPAEACPRRSFDLGLAGFVVLVREGAIGVAASSVVHEVAGVLALLVLLVAAEHRGGCCLCGRRTVVEGVVPYVHGRRQATRRWQLYEGRGRESKRLTVSLP